MFELGKSIGSLVAHIGADTTGLDRALTSSRRSLRAFGQGASAVGRTLTASVTLPAGLAGAAVLKMGGDFEQAMNQVRAVSGATGTEFKSLRGLAAELGRTTQYSASQAASGMGFLAMAGFEANQILGAMPSVLQLAAAAQMDLGQAADITSNILAGYGLQVEELGRANDVLVKAFTSANVNLSMLGQSLKYVGPVARSAGLEFETTAAAIALMGNAGIQGSMAGTGLRQAIGKLLDPSKEAAKVIERLGLNVLTATGRLRPLEDIIRQLEPHADDTAAMLEIFGQRAGPAMAALVSQGADALAALEGKLKDSGGIAKSIADVQMEGFNGQMRALKSAVEGLAIAIGDAGLLAWATKWAGNLAGVTRELANLNPETLSFITRTVGIAAVAGPAALGIGLISKALSVMLGGLGAVARFWKGGLILAGIAGWVSAISTLHERWDEFVDSFPFLWNYKIKPTLDAIGGAMRALSDNVYEWLVGRFAAIASKLSGILGGIKEKFFWLYDAVVGHSIVPDLVKEVSAWMTDGLSALPDQVGEILSRVVAEFERLRAGVGAAASDVGGAVTRGLGAADWERRTKASDKSWMGINADIVAAGQSTGDWGAINAEIQAGIDHWEQFNDYTDPWLGQWQAFEEERAAANRRASGLIRQAQEEEAEQRKQVLYMATGDLASHLGSMSALMRQFYEDSGGQAKKYWRWYKNLAIAETIVSTASAIMGIWKSYSGLGPLGTAAAIGMTALVAGIGATKVALIQRQEPAASFAAGGIFTKHFVGSIEAAEGNKPEAIIPLDRLDRMLSGQPGRDSPSREGKTEINVELHANGQGDKALLGAMYRLAQQAASGIADAVVDAKLAADPRTKRLARATVYG